MRKLSSYPLIIPLIHKQLIHFIAMLKSRAVVLDFEGFRHKKSGFILKELAIFTENYTDTVSVLPPASFNTLSLSEQKS